MGSGKKKDKKKKRKREYEYDEESSPRKNAKEDNDYNKYLSKNKETYKSRKKENSPPVPPGMDWPYEAPKVSSYTRSPLSDGDTDWMAVDDRNRDRDYQNEVDRKYQSKLKDDIRKTESTTATSSQGDESLSIEETNKLRAKLGLKPLQIGSSSSTVEEKSYEDREDVHKPAGNISVQQSSEKIRDKMEAIREKRKINQKLLKVRGIADDDDPVIDSAAAWVAKSRMLEKEKVMAEKRAQMLEELDEEFGVSDIVEDVVGNKNKQSYTSKDLKGLKVEHKGKAFQDGEVVLTLKDKGILDEDNEDVLMNINIQEEEKAKKNVYNRTHKPGYRAYDEVDDDTGLLKIKGVLDKYDDEINGTKQESFRLDSSGIADLEGETGLEKIRNTLKAQQVSLESDALKLARDYFTEEEMIKFKKPKTKVRKVVRKRQILKADDLLKLDLDSVKDRGSRKLKNSLKNSLNSNTEQDMEITPIIPDELDYFVAVNQVVKEDEPIIDDDETEQELQLALERSRRSKVKKEKDPENGILERMATIIRKQPQPENEQSSASRSRKKNKGTIILDSTSEFCRTLGEIPTIGPQTSHNEVDENEDMELETTQVETKGGWERVQSAENETKIDKKNDDIDDNVLEPEPLPSGMASTLRLANMKGYLKSGNEKVRKFDPLNLPETKAEVDIEKLRDEEKAKYSRGGAYDRDRYDPYAFKEKTNYKPNVKLEYVDNKGRELSQKEAFRLLSHKFHGKGSGKLKTEKRANKIKEEKKLQLMSSIDTPLNTAAMFKEKQKASQSPYIVLSGGGKNLLSGGSLKK
ncbi:U4/U6.U5 tri-snRNP-associated protein 1 isoform X1 [Hydra vulgaris]|uniref:U4/U6.U5 tri-snRNP-associated protein 1 isoform X1 n=1 Tax=Hydra vulgaris TaxID=6087 RepID=UPI0006416368|nr:U4/U6.U5 tri-snRNP-associated protein 1 [Hydra vulgaris]